MTPDQLRRIAQAATEGPWGVLPGVGVCQNRQVVEPITEDDYTLVGIVAEERIRPEDAEFIATFNPQRVLELLDENQRLSQRVTRLSNLERRNAKQRDEAQARLAEGENK